MKKILLTLAAVAMIFAGCTKGFEERLTNLENRVSELEAFVTNLNSEVKGIQTIVSNLQKNVYVTGVEPIKNASGVEIGYKLTFNQGNPIEIKHGNTGAIGETGAAGKTPTIDLGDDGQWYWRYSGGDWILDSNDNKIPVYKNIEFEIDENGHLLLYVNDTYTADLGKVEGEQGPQGPVGDSLFKSVTVTEDGVVIVLNNENETKLVLPFNAAAADEFALNLQLPSTPAVLGGKITIGYEITGCSADAAALFVYQLPEGWAAEIDSANGTIELTTNEKAGKLVLFAINNETGDTKAKFIDFDPEKLLFLDVEKTAFEIPAKGGSVIIPVSTGLSYRVDAPDWITPKKTTKAMVQTELELVAVANEGETPRSGNVTIVNEDTKAVLFTFTVSQKNFVAALVGEYIESYSQYGQMHTGTLKIEESDDFTKGTYKVTLCGTTLYANYESGKLNCYDGNYTRTLTVSSDYSRFEIKNLSLGYTTYSDYVAIKPLGAPELTEAELALVGVYNEVWDHKYKPATNAMTISASEEAAYGRLKVKLLVTEDGSAYTGYATLEASVLKVQIGGQSHPKFGTVWNPDEVLELTVNANGTLTMSNWTDGNYNKLGNYVATKVAQSDDENAEAGPLAGTWNVTCEMGDQWGSNFATKTGTMVIKGSGTSYTIESIVGVSYGLSATLEGGNALVVSKNGATLKLVYDAVNDTLTSEGVFQDWEHNAIKNIVATR